jgi:hypothetical protein
MAVRSGAAHVTGRRRAPRSLDELPREDERPRAPDPKPAPPTTTPELPTESLEKRQIRWLMERRRVEALRDRA